MLLMLAFMCKPPLIINKTDEWNRRDRLQLEASKTRCEVLFPGYPCIKVFIKKEAQVYNVICKKEEK